MPPRRSQCPRDAVSDVGELCSLHLALFERTCPLFSHWHCFLQKVTQTVASAPINAKSLHKASSFLTETIFSDDALPVLTAPVIGRLSQTRVLICLFRFSFLLISLVRRMRFFLHKSFSCFTWLRHILYMWVLSASQSLCLFLSTAGLYITRTIISHFVRFPVLFSEIN